MGKYLSVTLACVMSLVLQSGIGALWASDIYVKAGASGKGTSPADAYDELWKAVDRAKRGDVIHVAAGTYNGKGGSGHFVIKVPNLTIAGGYNADFSARDPFKNLTILERARDFKGDWTLLPEGIIAGDQHADHSGLIVDGFVLDCQSRNSYKNNVVALKAPTYPGKAFEASSANIKIRNCIIANPVGEGFYVTWQGKENEISNCFILNTFYAAIECRSAQPGSEVSIKNNTIAFGWFYPSKGGAMGIFVGSKGAIKIENNIIAFMVTEGGEAGFGVTNTFGNEDTVMKNNVFFSLPGGYYKYMDSNKQSLVAWKESDLEEMNDESTWEDYMLSEGGGNSASDPLLSPDKGFITMFAGFVESEPGKLDMDEMNQWRQSLGLPLQAKSGSARQNFGFAYPVKAVIPNLVSKLPDAGAKDNVAFETYKSASAEDAPADYEETQVGDFKKGGKREKGNAGAAVAFKAQMGDAQNVFELENAPRTDYLCVQLVKPGESMPSREYVYGYILKGSQAQAEWDKLFKKKDDYNKAGGVTIKGKAFDFKKTTYSYPVGIIIDEVKK